MSKFFKSKGKKQTGLIYKDGVDVMLNPSVFRPMSKSRTAPINFIFANGGVGDYINWTPVLKWVHEQHPHVDARIYVTTIFAEVAEHLFRGIPRWEVRDRKQFGKFYEPGSLIAFPKGGEQLLNAVGQHLLDLGFNYFGCTAKAPEGYNALPEIDFEADWSKWPEMDQYRHMGFAIFTPGATAGIRTVPVEGFNALVEYTRAHGIMPVFLGKREVAMGYTAKFADYDYSRGVDLRERTTLLEATALMNDPGCKFVIGLDNGLLHMAGTTKATVIFGHNIADIEHRRLRRSRGRTIDVSISKEELSCIGCQSHMRFTYNHDFKKCMFGDDKCLELLFGNGAPRFKAAIDEALREP